MGSYQLLERIGEGGSAHVHRALGPGGVPVAVKLLAPHAELEQPTARARLIREIKILSAVHHPSLITLLDHGVDDELGPYLVTPLLTGKTARELIAGRALAPEAALLLAEPVAAAMTALHAAGLTHRDLKPENLLTTPAGRLLVCDLGLALGPSSTRYTDEGAVVGSIPYMAPEQIEGGAIGPAADVWAIGVMIYEWVTGRRPFARERASEEAAAILVGQFAPLEHDRRVTPELAALVAACLARDPAARPTAAALGARVGAELDWHDPASRELELAALFADPAGFVDRVREFRVRREKRRAGAAAAAGKPFLALAHVDRGLAYAPDDGELRALAEAIDVGREPAPAAEVAPAAPVGAAPLTAPGRRWVGWAALAALLAIALAAALGFALRSGERRAAVPVALDAAPPSSDELGWQVFKGMMGLMERGIAAKEREAAAAPVAAVAPTTPAAPTGAAPLPDELLGARPPARELGLAAARGEPLVPRTMLEQPDADRAITEIDAEVAAHPDDPATLLGQAMVSLATSKEAVGLGQLAAVVDRFPDDVRVHQVAGFVAVRRGRYREAEAAWSRALAIDPDDEVSLHDRGILYHRLGNLRAAYRDLTRAVDRHPDDLEALAELIRIYDDADRLASARPLIDHVVELRPDWAIAWLTLARTQDGRDALESVERALRLDDGLALGWTVKCKVQRELGDDADDACRRACGLGDRAACKRR